MRDIGQKHLYCSAHLQRGATPSVTDVTHRAILVDGQVWTIRPVALPPAAAELAARKGNATSWLSLISYVEKRRIAPVPPDWETWPEDQLAAAVRTAEVTVARVS
jgi:hypothetical protein